MLDVTAPRGGIAIVAHTHPSVTRGGAEIAAYSLYQGLLDAGVEACFIAACPSADRHRLALASDREFAVFTEPERYEAFYQLAGPDVWRQLRAILLACGAGLVNFQHFLNFGAGTLLALRRETSLPFVVSFHEFIAICRNDGQMVTRPARRLCRAATPDACTACFPEHSGTQFIERRALLHEALAGAAAYVSPSHFVAGRMIEWGLPASRFRVIENGLAHPPAAQMAAPRAPASPFVFGYFGQITPYKGMDTLLDAIERLEAGGAPIEIRVHGSLTAPGEAFRARFDQIFATSRIATYHGAYDNADVHTLMAACDYVLVPSTWWENSPVVIQEAFASGRPVICSGIGGMAEKVVDGVSGLHARPGDAASLAATILRAADPALHAALCAGLPPARDRTAMARDYLALFAEIAAAQPVA